MKRNQIVNKALDSEATYQIIKLDMSEYEVTQFSLQNHLGNTNHYKLTKIYGENGIGHVIHVSRENQFNQTFQTIVKVSANTGELLLMDNTIINGKLQREHYRQNSMFWMQSMG